MAGEDSSTGAERKTGSAGRGRVGARRFQAQQPVRWLAPTEILRGASGEFFGGLFSRFVDNRDRQALVRDAEVYHHPAVRLDTHDGWVDLRTRLIDGGPSPDEVTPIGDDEVVTIDYVADVGDGFGATWAVADLMARPQLAVAKTEAERAATGSDEPWSTSRGELVIMGGDEVYPVAEEKSYDDRTVGPYLLAYEDVDRVPVYAIPGNHDWYDGLAAFLTVFTDDEGIYRRQSKLHSVQRRSYFAIALPHNWWIWGVDVGLSGEGRVDYEQLDYFREAFKLVCRVDADDRDGRIIVCVSEPSWLKRTREEGSTQPDQWDNLVSFLHAATDDHPWDHVRMILSGDRHYYARHNPSPTDDEAPPRPTLVTSGGGGAYLSSTWGVPDSFDLDTADRAADRDPAADPADRDIADEVAYTRSTVWPSKPRSLAIGFWGLFQVPLTNPQMASLMAVIYGLFSYASLTGRLQPTFLPARGSLDWLLLRLDRMSLTEAMNDSIRGSVEYFGAFLIAALFLSAVTAMGVAGWKTWPARLAAIAVHATLHAVAAALTMAVSVKLVVELPASDPYRWERSAWVLAAVGALLLLPVAYRWIFFGVAEVKQTLVLVPPALAVGLMWILDLWVVEDSRNDIIIAGLAVLVVASTIGGILGLLAFTLYMVVSQVFGAHLNELFVGIRSEGHKQFLRLEFGPDRVVGHAIGYERVVPRTVRWKGQRKDQPVISQPRLVRQPTHRSVDRFTVDR